MLLVFLHFLGGSLSAWAGVTRALPPRYASMAVDLPGFGSSADQTGYSVAAMADHVTAAIRSKSPEQFAIIGHSMGAKVAAVVARRAEDGELGLAGLSHLVLIAGSPPGPEPMADDKRAAMLSWFQGDAANSRREAGVFIDNNTHALLPVAVRAGAITDVLRTNRDAWAAWLTEGSREDWKARVGELAVPTLIIAGEKDEALGHDAQRAAMVPHFADVAIEVLAGSAHLLPMERPLEVAALVAAHVDVSASPVPAPYRALIRSRRVSEGTRRLLLARVACPDRTSGALSPQVLAVLDAIARRVLPQTAANPIDLAARINTQLAANLGDGWRYADLPADVDAAERGARTLDTASGASGFAALEGSAQEVLLGQAAAGDLKVSGEGCLTAPQMRLWFQDVCSAATRAYVSHPATLARLGYSGIANGGDGPRKIGRTVLHAGERDPWEPTAGPS